MGLLTPTERLQPNKWYPIARNNVSLYPPPQKVLKDCLGLSTYKFSAKMVTVDFVRAACVMPKNLPYSHLLAVPWSMVWNTDNYRMIIVSVQDNRGWIQTARLTGATAWNIGGAQTCVYEYQDPDLDEHGLEIRNSGLRGQGNRSDIDTEGIIDDLLHSQIRQIDLAVKWGVSAPTIANIAKRNGIRKKKVRTDVKTSSHNNTITL